MRTGACYWRFKGDKAWRYGYVTHESGQLWRIGLYNGDMHGGYVVDPFDVETKPYA